MPKRASSPEASAIVIDVSPGAAALDIDLRVYGPLHGQARAIATLLRGVAEQIEQQLRAPGLLVPAHTVEARRRERDPDGGAA